MKSNIIKKIKVLPSSDVEELNDNKEAQAVPSSIGDKLRGLREKKAISIRDIADNLRIGEHFLRAIESMDLSALPERVYTLGFVRSYAIYLGIEPQISVNQFKEEMYGNYQGEVLSLPEPVTEVSRANWKIILLCVVIVCAIIFSWYKLTRQSHMLEPEKPVVTTEDIKAEAQPEVTPQQPEPIQVAPVGLRNHVEQSQKVFIEHNLKPKNQTQQQPARDPFDDGDADQ